MSRVVDPAPLLKWVGHQGPFGRNTAWTTPDLPGVVVRHCGHPTALWPYHVEGFEQPLGTFSRLRQAQAAAEDCARTGSVPLQRRQDRWFVSFRAPRWGRGITVEVSAVDMSKALLAGQERAQAVAERACEGAGASLRFMHCARRPPDDLELRGERVDHEARVTCAPVLGVDLPRPWLQPQALPPRLDLRNHSPNGFEWGYGGSGLAQLAVAAAAFVAGDAVAETVYQTLKDRVFARITTDAWRLSVRELRASIDSIAVRPTGGDAD